MEMLSGAEMVVRSLIDQGVKQVFGYPGGAVLDIYDALHTVGGIDHVLVRHEQAAVHMADGLARAWYWSPPAPARRMQLPALRQPIWTPSRWSFYPGRSQRH